MRTDRKKSAGLVFAGILVLLIFHPGVAYSIQKEPYTPDDNTLLLLHLDEGIGEPQDTSKFNTKVVNEEVSWTTEGKFGSALQFSDEGLTIADVEHLNLTDNFTIEAWVKPTAWAKWRDCIFIQEKYLVDGFRYGFDANGHLIFWTTQSGGDIAVTSDICIDLDTFIHAAVVYSKGTAKLYLNGVLVGSGSGTYIPSSAPLRIGQGADYFQGVIDEVRISNKAREF